MTAPVPPTHAAGELAGLAALVTGGRSGIGRAVVAALRARGAAVSPLDRGPAEDPDAVVADVTDDAAVRAAVDRAAARHGRLDIVVCSAGVGSQGAVEDSVDAEWLRVLDVNVLGVARTVRAALAHLERSPSPAVVAIGSVAARVGLAERVVYSASKGALEAMSRAMAADLAPRGIRMNVVAPGYTATPWIERRLTGASDPAAELAALTSMHPLGRLVAPEEVAAAVVHLASPAASATTGAVLVVDGGMTAVRAPVVS